jgi:pyrroline-5-carboxylate reductase
MPPENSPEIADQRIHLPAIRHASAAGVGLARGRLAASGTGRRGSGRRERTIMLTIGFIGGGRVTRILAGGWARTGALPGRMLVCDPNGEAFDALQALVPSAARAPLDVVSTADVVFIALHPPAIAEAVAAIAPHLRPGTLVVSLAPKVPLAALAQLAGTPRVARMIPNAPSIIGRGYNPVSYGPGLDADARARLAELFRPWGQAPEVPEAQLEGYAILTGMGPTYFWYQWQALRELAGEFGLPAQDADAALMAMVDGSVATLLTGGLSAAATMDLVPVKPLAEMEPTMTHAYRALLSALHAKIRPAVPVASV